jgi:hypothetical protein
METPSQNLTPPQRLIEHIKANEEIVLGLVVRGHSRQQAEKHPQGGEFRRKAWDAAPMEAKTIIERIIVASGTKTDIRAHRFMLLRHEFLNGGINALLAEEKRITDKIANSAETRPHRQQKPIERRPVMPRMSAKQRRERRASKALEMIQDARHRGLELHPTGRCISCGKTLTDEISKIYRLGSGCRAEVFRRHGKQAVEEALGIKTKEAA